MCKHCREYTGLELLLQDKFLRKEFGTLRINLEEETKKKIKKVGRISRIMAYISRIFK